MPLTERVGRGLRLTPAGEALAEAAVDVAVALERARAACDAFLERPAGRRAGVRVPERRPAAAAGAADARAGDRGHHARVHRRGRRAGRLRGADRPDGRRRRAPARRRRSAGRRRAVQVVPLLREPLDLAVPLDHPLAPARRGPPGRPADLPWIAVREGVPRRDACSARSAPARAPRRGSCTASTTSTWSRPWSRPVTGCRCCPATRSAAARACASSRWPASGPAAGSTRSCDATAPSAWWSAGSSTSSARSRWISIPRAPGVCTRSRRVRNLGWRPVLAASTVPGVTQSSDAKTERLPIVGALARPSCPSGTTAPRRSGSASASRSTCSRRPAPDCVSSTSTTAARSARRRRRCPF